MVKVFKIVERFDKYFKNHLKSFDNYFQMMYTCYSTK